jgi:guanyl-specific ribonuclease Sa
VKKWLLIGMAAILAAVAWKSLRENGPMPMAVPQTSSQNAPAAAPAPAEAALDMPPPLSQTEAYAYPAFLPPEAVETLQRIERGGPYPHRQDDGVFQNRERRLPPKPRGYYREYTVETPGSPDRGARRIVTGGQPPVEYFYTEDHYRSFRRFTLDGTTTTPETTR